jgi:hypothetical protein
LRKGDPGGNLDLRSDNVDTSDLLRDRVLDLDSRVDLNEVVSTLLVDQKLGGTGVSVLDSTGELEGVVKDGLSDRFSEVRRRGDLDDLRISMT